jgi:CDP-glucose 4,6-dehydratase
MLAEQLAARPDELRGQAFNFSSELQITVRDVVKKILVKMGSNLEPDIRNETKNEIRHQLLSASKARRVLGWRPLFSFDEGLAAAIAWYQSFLRNEGKGH